jgi:ribonuclease D
MIKYAANDVIYLPKIYNLMQNLIKETKTLTLNEVLDSCKLYLKYPDINLILTPKTRDLEENSQIQGLIK